LQGGEGGGGFREEREFAGGEAHAGFSAEDDHTSEAFCA
jgi:hypothetical protein